MSSLFRHVSRAAVAPRAARPAVRAALTVQQRFSAKLHLLRAQRTGASVRLFSSSVKDAEIEAEIELPPGMKPEEAAALGLQNEDVYRSSEPAEPMPVHAEHKKGNVEQHTFQTETSRILDIVTNSLYTDKEVFLRELVSNASDALEKARYQMANGSSLVEPELPLEIRIFADEENKTIIIQDTGIGMTADEMVNNLGTIARSGSRKFVEELDKAQASGGDVGSSIIGQFGVGFYSAFMVADKVEVYSKSAVKEGPAHYWCSNGTGSYELAEAEGVQRGTKIIMHLKEKTQNFAIKYKIEGIIRKYSNFVGFPIYLNQSQLLSVGALWLKDKSQVSEEQYSEFYRYLSGGYDEPTFRLHFSSDVPIAIKTLLYLPSRHSEKLGISRLEPGVSLYSRKVLIQAKSKDILPDWLRFVKGAVDSEDIPLNISRENMQESALMTRLNSALTRKIIRFLEEQARNDPEKYQTWLDEFGSFLKEGVCSDQKHKKDIAKLLRFQSSRSEREQTSLDEYISRMPPSQTAIYYLIAPNRASALASPYYEAFQKKNIEVLFGYMNIDDFVMQHLEKYNDRKIVSVSATEAQDIVDPEENMTAEQVQKNESLVDFFKEALSGRVLSVKTSTRLVSSPAIVVDHESSAVRRLMKMVHHSDTGADETHFSKQKLEINPNHPIMEKLVLIKDEQPELAKLVAEQIFDNALIAADIMDNPRTMLGRINQIIESSLQSAKSSDAN